MKKITTIFLLVLLMGAGNQSVWAAEWPGSQQNFVSCERGDDEHWRVQMLQYLLRAKGYTVAVDGDFGRQTENAVRLFQKRNDLEPNGRVRDPEWKLLVPEIRRGDSGNAVRALQVGINRFIHEHTSPRKRPIPVNGSFGPATEKWLREVQEDASARGVADGKTWFDLLFDEH